MTIEELSYNILNILRGGTLSDDERLSQEQVKFIINYTRALFVKQSADKGQFISPLLSQSVCLDMKLADKSDCNGIQTNCLILRSVLTIPEILRLTNGLAIMEASGVDREDSFIYIPFTRARWSKYNKFTYSSKRYFIRDNYLFVLNDIYMEKFVIQAIYTNPQEALNTSTCAIDYNYPVPADMVDGITNYIVKNILMLALLVKGDDTNDSSGIIMNNPKNLNTQDNNNPNG